MPDESTQTQAEPNSAKFRLGNIIIARGAWEFMAQHALDPVTLLNRHGSGDWGDLCAADKAHNDEAVKRHQRILSLYVVSDECIWVITEPDRSETTLMLASDY